MSVLKIITVSLLFITSPALLIAETNMLEQESYESDMDMSIGYRSVIGSTYAMWRAFEESQKGNTQFATGFAIISTIEKYGNNWGLGSEIMAASLVAVEFFFFR